MFGMTYAKFSNKVIDDIVAGGGTSQAEKISDEILSKLLVFKESLKKDFQQDDLSTSNNFLNNNFPDFVNLPYCDQSNALFNEYKPICQNLIETKGYRAEEMRFTIAMNDVMNYLNELSANMGNQGFIKTRELWHVEMMQEMNIVYFVELEKLFSKMLDSNLDSIRLGGIIFYTLLGLVVSVIVFSFQCIWWKKQSRQWNTLMKTLYVCHSQLLIMNSNAKGFFHMMSRNTFK
jgi:hypothetical protein